MQETTKSTDILQSSAMQSSRRHFRSPIGRMVWLAVSRVLTVMLTASLLVVSLFGGTTFLVHQHHERVSHWHSGPADVIAEQVADCHTHRCPADLPPCDDGVPINIPDQDQALSRAVELPAAVAVFDLAVVPVWCPSPIPGWPGEPGTPADGSGFPRGAAGLVMLGWSPVAPRHLCGLDACARLMWTSSALLV